MGFSEFFTCLYESRLICIVIDGHVNVLSRTTERLTGAQFTCIGKKNMHSCLHCMSVYHTVSIFKSFKALILILFFIFHAFPILNKSYHTTSERGERICLIWVDISDPSKRFSTIPITQDGQLCIHSAIRRVSVNKNSVVITQLSASVPEQMK